MNDEIFMNACLKEAYKAYENGEVPVGAVVVHNNKIISKAYNRKEKSNCAIDHAEIIAITKATKKMKNWRLNDCVMYVNLEPCPMCASAIKQSRISKVVYLYDSNNVDNSKIAFDIYKSIDGNKPVEISKLNGFSDNFNIVKEFFSKKRY